MINVCRFFYDGPNVLRIVNWTGIIEILTFAFQINGGLVGSSNVRFIETDAYSSGPISFPRAGIIEASELLPLIMQHYNAKLRLLQIE